LGIHSVKSFGWISLPTGGDADSCSFGWDHILDHIRSCSSTDAQVFTMHGSRLLNTVNSSLWYFLRQAHKSVTSYPRGKISSPIWITC